MTQLRVPLIFAFLVAVTACAGADSMQRYGEAARALYAGPPPADTGADFYRWLYLSRTWLPSGSQTEDLNAFAMKAKIQVQHSKAKILGPSREEGMRSLAVKLWLIENAQHTIDAVYYIFSQDRVGGAVSGALCNAVKRGVDVRIMVDSLGSVSSFHNDLKAIETCAEEAGFMRDAENAETPHRARVQVVIFNAISKYNYNRRSHDKLLVVDGAFADKAAVMTGGRNISLDYYGIKADGTPDPTAYRDLEILLRPDDGGDRDAVHVGIVTELYYTVLFNYAGNKRIRPSPLDSEDASPEGVGHGGAYQSEREKAQRDLAFLKAQPDIKRMMSEMPHYMRTGFRNAKVRIAHELDNLTNENVVTGAVENKSRNPNSIQSVLKQAGANAEDGATLRIVSPYLFVARLVDEKGNVIVDEAAALHAALREHPNSRLEIITNSVLTSDNFFAQAIIDMDTAPRLLLDDEMMQRWVSSLKDGELNPSVVDSEKWRRLVNNPQIFIYETGRLDAVQLGGEVHYGKLHAKFLVGKMGGFIGTSNFDYRSRLFNNEMGFFIQDPGLETDLVDVFEWLKKSAYRWGSPEWLQMRKAVMDAGGFKGSMARRQRGIFKSMRALGIEWQF